MGILSFFEPEEAVGNVWHDLSCRLGNADTRADRAVTLDSVRPTLAVHFRALGGAANVDIGEAPQRRTTHRRSLRRRVLLGAESAARPSFDSERLRLPPIIACFANAELNKAAYLWLCATAALAKLDHAKLPPLDATAAQQDAAYVKQNTRMLAAVDAVCPGLRSSYKSMCDAVLQARKITLLHGASAANEQALQDHLRDGLASHGFDPSIHSTVRLPPVPFWIDFLPPLQSGADPESQETSKSPPPGAGAGRMKQGERRHLDQADRKDSFIVHRFESILSWAESMNINRTVDDDSEEDARKAADDQDEITLSRHHKKTASRLHLHLELSPAEAKHEALSGKYLYPEWNYRSQDYLADHCRVLEADAGIVARSDFAVDAVNAQRVRRQFEVLKSRRILQPRQTDGADLDIDALIAAQADLAATGRGSDRIYVASRRIERDLSVALLLDTSRSTESDMDGNCVIDVARNALSGLAHGLDACGDRLGIWGFSSLKRKRVFLTRCKDFAVPMSPEIDSHIASLRPGHYTRLGAAIRHVTAQLAKESSTQRLLLILTDGKPNDLDHYEGLHGIEDSRMAVREARRQGLIVHGIIIDEDGQDWFARIFERSGFTLLPRPERLLAALPDIYRSLTQEI